MLFSSLEFIFIFFPISLVVYYIAPRRARNAILLGISLVFYAWSGLSELPIMLSVILINYLGGIAVARLACSGKRGASAVTAVAVTVDIGILFFFKYFGLATDVLRLVPFFGDLPRFNIPLPIGISFYTFQSLSYLVDVYRRETEAQTDPIKFATYIALYPQLIAGPIVRYSDVAEALERKRSSAAFADGLERFIFGLSKKMILANPAGEIWSEVASMADGDRGAIYSWLGIVCFAFQIYFDFSGYSDMAIGLGKIYGFDFPENFNHPYVCESVTDFWKRWHITLSSFFKSYVYIPLGGNRRGRARMYLNLLIVWSLTGLWHGASYNFIFWGIYYFLLLAFEKSKLGQRLIGYLPKNIYRLFTLLFVLGGWLIFACDRTGQLMGYLWGMFSSGVGTGAALYDLVRLLPFLLVSAIFSTPIPIRGFEQLKARRPIASALISFSLFLISVSYLVNSSYNPFLYFRF